MEKFLRDFVSTIKMVTPLMMIFPIWNVCPVENMHQDMRLNITNSIKKKLINIYQKSDLLQKNGMQVKKGVSGINNMQLRLRKIFSQKNLLVSIVERYIRQNLMVYVNFALIYVSRLIEDCRAWTMKVAPVLFVRRLLKQINIQKFVPVVKNVDQSLPIKIERVYNLEIEDQHEYFANGILVANCIDALRYALEDLIQSTQIDWEAVVNT